ncbi:AzlD family protein [Roseovarius sp. MMSF_3281]|uniref:AzlD family protein n=1 Tax=Roseovarius sp. MMSF_3281 TaxID=3046694 RepID=UPI00273E80A6|nr:AzlD domain-containing protein [Roseovarius sp. MMSF_3281]
MPDFGLVLLMLAGGTFAIRLGGYWLGRRLPATGGWAQGLSALPGCLILSLVAVQLLQGGPAEWGAALIAVLIALLTRNLPLTMLAGILAVLALRAVV